MDISNERLSKLSPAKRALLEARLGRQRAVAAPRPTIAPWPHADWAPTSFGQARFWVLDRLDPGTPEFNSAYAVHLRGPLNVDALRRSLEHIVERHEPLRTTFALRDGEPVQMIHPPVPIDLTSIDLTDLAPLDRSAAYAQHARELSQLRFDLQRGPVMHHRLVRRGDDDHTLLLTVHHVVFDRWSAGVLLDELMQAYDALSRGAEPALKPLAIRYADHAAHQRAELTGDHETQLLNWWKQTLGDDVPVLELPTDRPRAAQHDSEVARRTHTLPPTMLADLKALGRSHHASLFHVLLAGFASVLHRYTQQDDFAIGVPIAGRQRIETEPLIGLMINTVPMRQQFDANITFADLIARVRNTAVEALAHGKMPFEKLVEAMRPQRDTDHMPITQVLFNLHNVPIPDRAAGDVRFELDDVEGGLTQFDMTMLARESDEGLYLSLTYNACLFDADRIERMLGHYQTLLRAAIADAVTPVDALPMLTEAEHQQLAQWNDTAVPLPAPSVLPLIDAQVQQRGEAVAVEQAGAQALTYRQLDERARACAQQLQAQGIARGDIVGLYVERSPAMIIGMLGILRAGAVLLPLDPTQPQQRLASMCNDANIKALLTHNKWRARLDITVVPVLDIDATKAIEPPAAPTDLTATDRAYIIYTSGSTGQPKGAINTHGGLVNEIAAASQLFGITADDRVLQTCAIGFDAALEEIFTTLTVGATLVLRTDATPLTGQAFSNFLDRQRLSVIDVPTALWHAWVHELSAGGTLPGALRTVIVGGEKASTQTYRRWLGLGGDGVRWINTYGPTETAIVATAYEPPRNAQDIDADRDLPIGKPIANTRIHIVNGHLQPVPIGVAGELCIAGIGVGDGYLNDAAMTAVRFVRDPFSSDPAARMYRTGDRAAWRSDGTIEFLGRVDAQIKLRGFRVEPGDIETALARLPNIDEAAVIVDDSTNERRLVAYLAHGSSAAPLAADVHEQLRAAVPPYMLPSAYVMLEHLPLTANGKVDRRALPKPDYDTAAVQQAFVEPRNDVERKLAALWREALGLERVGVHDSFFDSGGHSLLAVKLFARISDTFGVDLPLSALFEHDTIADFATLLRRPGHEDLYRVLVPIRPEGDRRPFFCVHGIGGDILCFKPLAKHLPGTHPFYGLQARGLNGDRDADHDITKMATHYIEQMRTIAPNGPYMLGGFSSGATIAYEMSRQLVMRGERVSLLAILDSSPPNTPRRYRPLLLDILPMLANLPRWLADDLMRGDRRKLLTRLRSKLRKAIRGDWPVSLNDDGKPRQVNIQRVFGVTDMPRRRVDFIQAHFDALRAYRPQPADVRVTLFRACTRPLLRRNAPHGGWSSLARRGVEVHTIAGAHEAMLYEPYVAGLAAQLQACMDAAEADARA